MVARLMEETLEVLGCTVGSIWLYDQTSKIQPAYQYSRTARWLPARHGESIIRHVIATEKPYTSDNLKNDPWTPDVVRPYIPTGVTSICVPIWSANTVIGAFLLNGEGLQKLTSADTHLLITLAEIAGNAIHRMDLHEQTKQKADEFAKLYETAHELAGQVDLPVVLNTIIDRATTLLGASNGTIALYDAERGDLELVAQKNFPTPLGTHRKLGR